MTPKSTYRLQFCPEFGFARAQDLIPYLSDLGISTIYASPVFQARAGSSHGYDILDHSRLNPELGTRKAFGELIRTVQSHGLTWLQDIVPNHMAYSRDNPWLVDVLIWGQASKYASYFDVDFASPNPNLKGRIAAPFLGKPLSNALQQGEIILELEAGGVCLRYYDLRLPLNAEGHRLFLEQGLRGESSPWTLGGEIQEEVRQLMDRFQDLADVSAPDLNTSEQFTAAKNDLWTLSLHNPDFSQWMQAILNQVNQSNDKQQPSSLFLHLLEIQCYRLRFFRTAMQEINYRRFFTINDLICLNMSHPPAFEAVHTLIFQLLEKEAIQGLRIDHLDGIADPLNYLKALRRRVPETYLVVEKILEVSEDLPEQWPIQGSTGYDFLNLVNGIFVDRVNEDQFSRIYKRFLGLEADAPLAESTEHKRLILTQEMQGDLENLTFLVLTVLAALRPEKDVTLSGLRQALAEVLVQFPVYRSYLSPEGSTNQDLEIIEQAFSRARRAASDLEQELGVLEELFTAPKDCLAAAEQERLWPALLRFQQLSGPLMAKGFEDTFLYLNNRLIGLNEVGGDPDTFGIERAKFHEVFQKRILHWPGSMNASATHDTKRGEDVRAKLNVLSEMPQAWSRAVQKWTDWLQGQLSPEKHPALNDQYLLLQTLLGTYPLTVEDFSVYRQRIREYMLKAVREGKEHSQWVLPDQVYEEKLLYFVDFLLPESGEGPFLNIFGELQEKMAAYGLFNSLAQTLLKMTLPGVPDFYQGTELWDLSLVDPDNRRAVDYRQRRQMLGTIREGARQDLPALVSELLQNRWDGRIKLYLIWKGLKIRNRFSELFASGSYLPLRVQGPYSRHVLAFAREFQGQWALVVVPRFLSALIQPGQLPCGQEVWQETRILLPEEAPSKWQESFSDKPVLGAKDLLVGKVLERFPVGLLVGGEEGERL